MTNVEKIKEVYSVAGCKEAIVACEQLIEYYSFKKSPIGSDWWNCPLCNLSFVGDISEDNGYLNCLHYTLNDKGCIRKDYVRGSKRLCIKRLAELKRWIKYLEQAITEQKEPSHEK